MRPESIILLSILFFSCTNRKKNPINEKSIELRQIQSPQFQVMLDEADAKGSVLIYDFQRETYYSNDFEWAKAGKLPASTFKIPNSIIALETGVVENDSTLFEWDGRPRALPIWEKDLVFKEAFHVSCVPCYQAVAREIGVERMNAYLSKLEYGVMNVDTTNIDRFWLEGASTISQFQQIDFLKRFYEKKLSISARTHSIMQHLMIIEANNSYTISGKTGWSIRNGTNNGWFVGYLEKENNTYFFASNVEPKAEFNQDQFITLRKDVVIEALKQLSILD